MWRPRSGGLGMAAISYVAVDYLRHLSPTWHRRLMPVLWSLLALVAVSRVPFYKHWSSEFRSLKAFVASMVFMLLTLLLEAGCVRFVTVVLGLDWHTYVVIALICLSQFGFAFLYLGFDFASFLVCFELTGFDPCRVRVRIHFPDLIEQFWKVVRSGMPQI